MGGAVSARRPAMPVTHLALALFVVAIWGTNFVVIHAGLAYFPPFTFAAFRFLLASLPLVLFIPKPKVPFALLAANGLLIGVGQNVLLLYALTGHIGPGLASLLVQTQAFFTVALAAWLDGERIYRKHAVALALCAVGIAVIGCNYSGVADLTGILLVLGAGLGGAGSNTVAKRAGTVDMLAVVVWSSLVAAAALLPLALLLEGYKTMSVSILHASSAAWLALAWQAIGNTLFGYAVWNWLLVRHDMADIAPMALLIPIFGMSTSVWLLAEPMPPWQFLAMAFVLVGLAVNLAPSKA